MKTRSFCRVNVIAADGPAVQGARHRQPLYLQYIPRNMHTVFALLCFVVVIHWLIFPYPSGLLHWHCGNLTIAPVPAKQPWWIWINTSCEFIMNDCITTTKQRTTKPCAYFLGYTVHTRAKSQGAVAIEDINATLALNSNHAKSRLPIVHNLFLSYTINLKFCTEQSRDTAMWYYAGCSISTRLGKWKWRSHSEIRVRVCCWDISLETATLVGNKKFMIWWVLCQKQVSRAGTSIYFPQYLWDVITCPCPRYLLLAQRAWREYINTHCFQLGVIMYPRHNFNAGLVKSPLITGHLSVMTLIGR